MPYTPPPSHSDLVKESNKRRDEDRKKKEIDWNSLAEQDAAKARTAKDRADAAEKEAAARQQAMNKWWPKEKITALQQNFKQIGYSNPPFDPRILNLPMGVQGAKFFRGAIIQSQRTVKALGQDKAYRLNFLYNPSEVPVNYNGGNVLPRSLMTEGQNAASLLLSGMQTTGFALLFDRTYEVASLANLPPKLKEYKSALAGGVYSDVRALERLVGIEDGYGPVQAYPLNVYFGASSVMDIGSYTSRPLGFFGYITGFNVTYTHFSHTMTPTRAVVNINMSQLTYDEQGEIRDPSTGETTGEAG